ELDQVSGHEARGETEVPQALDEEPAGVAAGAAGLGQRLLGRLDARLEPDQVADVALQALVQRHQEIHGVARTARQRSEERLQPRSGGLPPEVWPQIRLEG